MKEIEKSKTHGFYSPIIKKFKIKNFKSLNQPAFKRSLKDFNKLSRKNLVELNMYYIGVIYNLLKSKLPRLRTIKQKALPARPKKRRRGLLGQSSDSRRTTKRKARFRKGSPEAKRYMAKLRMMRK